MFNLNFLFIYSTSPGKITRLACMHTISTQYYNIVANGAGDTRTVKTNYEYLETTIRVIS
jgi:hypothetical protein